jgi:hypothetical protein
LLDGENVSRRNISYHQINISGNARHGVLERISSDRQHIDIGFQWVAAIAV